MSRYILEALATAGLTAIMLIALGFLVIEGIPCEDQRPEVHVVLIVAKTVLTLPIYACH